MQWVATTIIKNLKVHGSVMWHFKIMGMTKRPMNEGTYLLFTLGGPMTASFLQP